MNESLHQEQFLKSFCWVIGLSWLNLRLILLLFLYVNIFTWRWWDNKSARKCLWISLFSTSRFLFVVPAWPTIKIQSLSNILPHTLSLAAPWLHFYRTGLKWELFLALLFLSAHKKENDEGSIRKNETGWILITDHASLKKMMKAQFGRMRLNGPW